ncbi:MAG: TIGR03905 family TSCPD domain-containing protein [Bacteroidales bacterium]|nr:TIGR03905 family TSCPD domain-containing protein [Bacteroidales bacterium]
MKTLLLLAIGALLTVAPQQKNPSPDDFTINSDKTEAGVRTIVATPVMVCAQKITVKVDAKTDVIKSVIFTGGCPGNGKAVNILLQGMKVQDAVKKLSGVDCSGRGTSCTDQLSRILKKAYKL